MLMHHTGRIGPGILAAGVGVAAAHLVHALLPWLNPATAAVLLGVFATNAGIVVPRLRDGFAFAARSLLRIAVVLLGLQLSVSDLRVLGASGLAVVVSTVAVTFAGTQLMGRMLGVRRPLALLVATGFSVCGASAIAAMQPVAEGEEDDTVIAVALVTVFGSLAIVILPLLRSPLQLDYTAFGSWAGASVHDIGQTVATAARVGHGALAAAVVTKLTRVTLLGPLVAGVALTRRKGEPATVRDRRTAPVPGFVAAFVAAVLLRSIGLVPSPVLHASASVQQVLQVAALVGLGTGVSWQLVRRTGGRPLVLGLSSWVLVASVSYTGIRLLGR